MIIRDYCKNDISCVCDLMKHSLGYDIATDELSGRIEQMQRHGEYKILVAVENDNVLGFIGLHLGLAFEISGKVMRIIALAVKENCQGQGIGTKLVEKRRLSQKKTV